MRRGSDKIFIIEVKEIAYNIAMHICLFMIILMNNFEKVLKIQYNDNVQDFNA